MAAAATAKPLAADEGLAVLGRAVQGRHVDDRLSNVVIVLACSGRDAGSCGGAGCDSGGIRTDRRRRWA
eukprot:scaffold125197_cov30-Tisochrysis_lutea.AAC.4